MNWFGNGKSILVKDTLEEATRSFGKEPMDDSAYAALFFHIPLTTVHPWVQNCVLERTPHVGGYRIRVDINIKEIDPDFTLHLISD